MSDFATQQFNHQNFRAPFKSTFKSALSAAAIAALKAQLESIFPVNLNYSGIEHDYDVELVSSDQKGYIEALKFVFPVNKPYTLVGNPYGV